MLDRSHTWPESPDWLSTRIALDGLAVRSIMDIPQFYVSGDLDRFRAIHSLAEPVGLMGLAAGERYVLRMARDRMLVVGVDDDALSMGWNDNGYAITRMSSALHVFEIAGTHARELVARGCMFDDRDPSPCSTVQFAGITVSLYCHGDTDVLRLHLDRGLAPYLWTWINSQRLVRHAGAVMLEDRACMREVRC